MSFNFYKIYYIGFYIFKSRCVKRWFFATSEHFLEGVSPHKWLQWKTQILSKQSQNNIANKSN